MFAKKHAKPKTGYKEQSKAFLNQYDILGGKGMIYTTPQSNGNYYFRTWIAEERKYVRKGLRTKILEDAIKEGSSFLVVGRPITASKNPALALDEIIKKIS